VPEIVVESSVGRGKSRTCVSRLIPAVRCPRRLRTHLGVPSQMLHRHVFERGRAHGQVGVPLRRRSIPPRWAARRRRTRGDRRTKGRPGLPAKARFTWPPPLTRHGFSTITFSSTAVYQHVVSNRPQAMVAKRQDPGWLPARPCRSSSRPAGSSREQQPLTFSTEWRAPRAG
jgi:hypothetical protein